MKNKTYKLKAKTMKRTLIATAIFLLTALSVYSQQLDKWKTHTFLSDTSATTQDTVWIDTCETRYQYCILTVQDTGATYTDSIAVDVYDRALKIWCVQSVRKMADYDATSVTTLANVNANTQYFILNPAIWAVRVRLKNAKFVFKRTVKVSLLYKTYN